ncbi:FliH/SctL family protein [Paracraurococcus ruber]|uniref:Flagellar assembly protein H n=1 Tax=Paracraurococcus ruber TaxID=77675 RepID=A0ABS1D000_9PROT|nr:hypothetical protein [Paracraurococcus ruber]MBK1660025.1 hypothetical protein [Paracraurococcus ruber]
MTRPFLPPLLTTLTGPGGDLAERLAAEERQRDAAFQAGKLKGFEEGYGRGQEDGLAAGRAGCRAEHLQHAGGRQQEQES